MLDKRTSYLLQWDDYNKVWVCKNLANEDDKGICGETGLKDSGLAPILAVADAARYDIGIMADLLECPAICFL